jgi:general secretion pathway protein A
VSASAAANEEPAWGAGLGSSLRAADPWSVGRADPFAVTSDPRWYVPRPASEDALASLELSVRGGRCCTVLSGPPGIGKTMIVRVLAERLADVASCVYLPYAFLGIEDLCRWVLGLLEAEPGTGTPGEALLAAARGQAALGRALVLILDDASALPAETARALLALSDRARGALRLVVVPVDDGRAGRVVAALGEGVREVRFSAVLSLEETAAYVRARLQAAEASDSARARFDAATVRRIWRDAGGVPRLVHRFATAVLLGGDLGPSGPIGGPPLDVDPEGEGGEASESPLPALDLDPAAPAPSPVDSGAGPG